MQEHEVTLNEIRREATQLELDVDISTGRLDIFKRSDSETGFYSLQVYDDPRVLAAAWLFLQLYRVRLDRVDAARSELSKSPPQHSRRERQMLAYHVAGFILAIVIGSLTIPITSNPLLAFGVFLMVFAFSSWRGYKRLH